MARLELHAKKKTLSASEQDPGERAAWRWQAALLLRPAGLVFVDESGSHKALTPRYGSAPKGQRCHGQVPRNRGCNPSILAALGPAGLVGTMTVEGSTNTEGFLTYLEEVLCPALRPGQTVVLDNLSVHKNEAVRQRIEAAGCRRGSLPADSSDFHPIEHAFAELKRLLRKAKARTQEALESAIAAALSTLPPRTPRRSMTASSSSRTTPTTASPSIGSSIRTTNCWNNTPSRRGWTVTACKHVLPGVLG